MVAAVTAEKDPSFPRATGTISRVTCAARRGRKIPSSGGRASGSRSIRPKRRGSPTPRSKVRKLAEHFREVPEVLEGLARLYGRLGWKAERAVVLKELAASAFPKNQRVLEAAARGPRRRGGRRLEADESPRGCKALDPDSEIDRRARARAARLQGRPSRAQAARATTARSQRHRPSHRRCADPRGRPRRVVARLGARARQKAPRRRGAARPRRRALRRGRSRARCAARISGRHPGGWDTAEMAGARRAGRRDDRARALSAGRQRDHHRVRGLGRRRWRGPRRACSTTRPSGFTPTGQQPHARARAHSHSVARGDRQHGRAEGPEGLLLKLRVIKKDGSILEPEFVAESPR